MGGRVHEHIRSNVVSYVALVAFAAAGTAQAVDGPLPGTNQVGSEDIINNEVRSADIADGRIFNLDLADDIVRSGKVQDGTLTGGDVAANTLAGTHIDESTLFNDNSLTTDDVDESTLFNDNSLTAADLAANSINASEVATSSVGSDEIVLNSLNALDFAADSVGSSEIAAGAVTASELVEVSIQRRDDDVGPFATADFLIACPAGQTAIGGDAFNVSANVRINSSFPSESTTAIDFPEDGDDFVAWWLRYQSVRPFATLVTSFVICVEAS